MVNATPDQTTTESRRDFEAALDEAAESTDRLLATVDQMDDAALREPSLLAGWSRAHVLTHVARNADGLVNLVHWAVTGQETAMYAGGREGRDRDIAAGAARHIGDIRLDVNDSGERLLEAFAEFPDEAFARDMRLSSGTPVTGRDLPLLRVREVEIHHVDLGLGYTPAHWRPAFVARTLDQLAPVFCRDKDCAVYELRATDTGGRWQVGTDAPPRRTLSGAQSALLAWLTGRSSGDGLDLDPAGPVPQAPVWS